MSGGTWGYQQYRIEELAEDFGGKIKKFLLAVAKSEHIVDWAHSCDTTKEDAYKELYNLWLGVFDDVYGR